MRSGSFAGSVLKRRWISLRRGAARETVDHLDPLVGAIGVLRSPARGSSSGSASCPRGLGEDEDAPVVPLRARLRRACLPNGGRSGQRFSRIQSIEVADLRVGQVTRRFGDLLHPIEERPVPRRQSASAAASRGGFRLRAALTASIWAASSASSFLRRPFRALVVGVGRESEEDRHVGCRLRRRALPRAFSHWRSTVARWTVRLRANASIDERRRCCSPTTSRPAAA